MIFIEFHVKLELKKVEVESKERQHDKGSAKNGNTMKRVQRTVARQREYKERQLDLAKSDPGPFLDPNPKEKYGYGYRFFDPGTKMVSTRTRPVKRWVGSGQPAGHMGRPVFQRIFFFFFSFFLPESILLCKELKYYENFVFFE